MKTQVDKGMEKTIDLESIQHSYRVTNSMCSHDSFYECMSRSLEENLKGSSSQCSTITFPSFPICKINKTEQEFPIPLFENWSTFVVKEAVIKVFLGKLKHYYLTLLLYILQII